MLWTALRLPPGADASPPSPDALRGVAIWALQFTPRVAVLDEAVVAEVEASVRLFGGKRALRDRILSESKELGVVALAWATNSLAALALDRQGIENGFKKPLDHLRELRLRTAAELFNVENGRHVRYAGIVKLRQQPDTASGVVFMSLQDESGTVQVVCFERIRDEQREPMLKSPARRLWDVAKKRCAAKPRR